MVSGHNAPVTTAAPNISARIHSLNRPNLVGIGTIVWLSSELMFFAGLFAIYFTARAQNPPGNTWPPAPTELNVPYALVLGVVAGLLELVPLVGPLIVAILAGFLASTVSVDLMGLTLLFLGVLRAVQRRVLHNSLPLERSAKHFR